MAEQTIDHVSIDFSSGGIRILQIKNNEVVFLSKLAEELSASSFTYISNLRENSTGIIESLKKIPFPTNAVSYTLPQDVFLIQLIEIPMVNDAEIPETVYWKLSALLPEDIDSYFKDFLIVHQDIKNKKHHVLTFAIKKEYVLVMSNILAKVGLTGAFLEPPSLALHRYISTYHKAKPGAFINIGDTESIIGIFTKDQLLYSQIVPKGTNILKESLSKQLNAPDEKIQMLLDKALDKIPQDIIKDASLELTQAISNELLRILAFTQKTLNKSITTDNIFLSAHYPKYFAPTLPYLTEGLKDKGKLTVLDPTKQLKIPKDLEGVIDTSFTVVTGLNLRKQI